MKIHFFVETVRPRDMKRVRGLDGIDWSQAVEFPVLPRVGDMISINAADDFRKVEEVYIAAHGDAPRVSVHFAFQDDFCPVEAMTKAGWVAEP